MRVFGFMTLSEQAATLGVKRVACSPHIPLWAAGWCKPHKDFIPELAWDTGSEIWVLQPRREAIIARMENICHLDALRLLGAGRRLGAVGHDSRLRRAMTTLGLTQSQLAVRINGKEDFDHRMRWLEVLDYLIGTQHHQDTASLHTKVCLVENTASWNTFHRWLQGQAWSIGPGQFVLGDKAESWQIDLSSGDGKTRVLAFSGKSHIVVQIMGEDLAGLQDPDPRHVRVSSWNSFEDLIQHVEGIFSQKEGEILTVKSVRLEGRYEGGPIASHLLGLKPPRLRLRLGELIAWQALLKTQQAKQETPQILPHPAGLPSSAFTTLRNAPHPINQDEQDQLAQIKYACHHAMPGGLFRQDLPGVVGRGADLPARVVLYRPTNPFVSG